MLNKRFKIIRCLVLIVVGLLTSTSLHAQFNGGNVSSPYSMYGIGDLRVAGTALTRSMGGGGIAFRDPMFYNMINPASISIAPTQSFLLSIGVEGVNSYLSTNTASTSNNAATLSYIAARFPIAKGLGFGFSMNPYSSTGYSIRQVDRRDNILENIGSVNYLYNGTGDIGLYKAGLGWEIFKGFSIGANALYYLGKLKNETQVVISPYITETAYASVYSHEEKRFNNFGFEAGLQYHFSLTENSSLIIGGLYQPRIEQNIDLDFIETSKMPGGILDTVRYVNKEELFAFPEKIGAAVNFINKKLSISIDYTYEDFSKSFYKDMLDENIKYKPRHTYIFGIEYTPDRYSLSNFAKRISYRMGIRYNNSYYYYKGQDINEYAISIGVGIPLNTAAFSGINIGFEYASKGSHSYGMIQTQTFNFFVDVSLFSNTQWFVRYKNQ